MDQVAQAKPGYTAVVSITPFGAAPQQAPVPASSQPMPEPIAFTVRLPTIVMLEPKP
jgi:tripartite-type tricarboxylate transporter receptor subunit TctC